jgi:hypothetical protein
MRENPFGRIVADLIDQWLDNPSQEPCMIARRTPGLTYENYHPDYHQLILKAITDQTKIGWLYMMKGFLAKSWHSLASTYTSNRHTPPINNNDGQHRISRTIKAIFKCVNTIWAARNDALHRGQEAHGITLKTILDSEIVKLLQDRQHLPAADQHYCNISLEKILTCRPSYKRRRIFRVKKARERFSSEQATQTTITSYFSRVKITDHIRHKSAAITLASNQNKEKELRRQNRIHNTASTQRLLTQFLKERATNPPSTHTNSTSPTPPP